MAQVYACLAAFEEYPAFVPGLTAVNRRSARRLDLEADVNGTRHRWPVRVSELRRDRSVALTIDQRFRARARGELRRSGARATELAVEVEYELDVLRERLLGLLFDPQPHLEEGLARFREWVQDGGTSHSPGRTRQASRGR